MIGKNEYSGFVTSPNGNDAETQRSFSGFEEIPKEGYTLLVKARRFGRWWMLKGLKPDYARQSIYRELLHKEFDLTVHMQHPGIVSAVSLEDIPGFGECIVMEWIDGISLDKWLYSNPRRKDRRRVVGELLDAVEYAHSTQTVHRDIKPSNILITRNGSHVKIIDFGLGDTDSHAVFKQGAGTAGFMAPEQADGGDTDLRNDIYSLGRILQLMNPSPGNRLAIRRCLVPIDKRYGSVAELRRALNRYRSIPRFVAGIISLAILIIVFILSARFYTHHEPANQALAIPSDSSVIHSTHKTSFSPQISGVLSTHPYISDKTQSNSAAKAINSEEAIAEGYRQIDTHLKKCNIPHRIDTVTKIAYIQQDLNKIIEEETQHCRDYASAVTDDKTERIAIENRLLLYANEHYFLPWSQRLAERIDKKGVPRKEHPVNQ